MKEARPRHGGVGLFLYSNEMLNAAIPVWEPRRGAAGATESTSSSGRRVRTGILLRNRRSFRLPDTQGVRQLLEAG